MEQYGRHETQETQADDLRATVIIPSMIQAPRLQSRKRLQWQIAVAVTMIVVTLSGASILVSNASGRTTAAASTATPAGASFGRAASAPTKVPVTAATSTPHSVAHATSTSTVPALSYNASGELCHDTTIFVSDITQWTAPPGCYATIYTPDTAKYPYAPGFGYCNWWVRERHLSHPDITENNTLPRGTTPVAGAVVWFDPNVQGASSAGHWAQVVAVSPGGYWFLVSEMNFGWRGGGFGKIDYRYAHTGPGIQFIYASA